MHNNYEGGIVITDIRDHFLIFCVPQSEVPQIADSFSLKRHFSNNNRNLFKRMIANIKKINIEKYTIFKRAEIECSEQIKFLGYIVDINSVGNLIYNLLHQK